MAVAANRGGGAMSAEQRPSGSLKTASLLGKAVQNLRRKRQHTLAGESHQATSDMDSEHFDAKLYIKEKMPRMKLDQLVAKRDALKKQQKEDQDSMRDLVAGNLDTFIQCKDSITNLYDSDESRELFRSARDKTGTIQELRRAQAGLLETSKAIFNPLLAADEEMQNLKNVSLVLERHQTIFSMPETVAKHIQNGAYDAVIKGQSFMGDQRAGLPPVGEGGEGVNLLRGVFAEVDKQLSDLKGRLLTDLRATPVSDVQRAQDILHVLRRLKSQNLLTEFADIVRARFSKGLQSQALDFSKALMQTRETQERHDELARSTLVQGVSMLSGTSMWQSPQQLGKSWGGQSMASTMGNLSRDALMDRMAASTTLRGEQHMTFEENLKFLTARCGLNDAQRLLTQCGRELADTLIPFWQLFTRLWDTDDPLGHDGRSEQSEMNMVEEEEEEEEDHVAIVDKLVQDVTAEFRAIVWPVIERLAPERSSATPQQWRAGLLSVAEPVVRVLDKIGEEVSCSLVQLKDDVQRHFVQQSCQRLCAQIAEWEQHMDWTMGRHLHERRFLCTQLPERFESELTDLLDLWARQDDLCPNETQRLDIQEDFRRAHLAFLDLLHHLAFERRYDENAQPAAPLFSAVPDAVLPAPAAADAEPGAGAEQTPPELERLLAVLADCLAFEQSVVHSTYAAFRAWLSECSDGDTMDVSKRRRSIHPSHLAASATLVGDDDADFDAPARSPRSTRLGRSRRDSFGRRGSFGGDGGSPVQPGEKKKQKKKKGIAEAIQNVDDLRSVAGALRRRIVRRTLQCEMEYMAETVCIHGFLRTDVNWCHAAEPRGVRKYAHELALRLVTLHDATVRLTGGAATHEVLQGACDEVMVLLHHSARQLDLFDLTSTPQDPRCADAVINATLQIEVEVEFLHKAMGRHLGSRGTLEKMQLLEYLKQLVQPFMGSEGRDMRRKIDSRRQRVLQNVLEKQQKATLALFAALTVN